MNNLLETSLGSFYRLLFKRLIECIKESNQIPNDIKTDVGKRYKEVIPNTDTFILFEETKDTLKLLSNKSIKVVFILDEFIKLKEIGKLAFSNLKAIRDIDKELISIGFVGNQNLAHFFDHDTLQGLHTLFRFKFIYIHNLNREESDYIFKDYEEKFGIKMTKETRDKIYILTNGNLWLLKKIISIYNDKNELFDGEEEIMMKNLLSFYDIEITLDYFWDRLSKEDQESIVEIIKTNSVGNNNTFLLESGIIIKDNDNYDLFSPLLRKYLDEFIHVYDEKKGNESVIDNNSFIIDKEDRFIKHNGSVIGSDLTKTEFDVLAYLIENSGKAVTRDELGVVMWGDERFEKYSDYAIDRLISRIRSKIGENASAPKYLKTVKGVGFRFINS
jgi:DNA-binding winged helix-turn-helix (wHTH) protein